MQLAVSGLQAWYGESHILHGVTFDVQPGEVVTLLGRNGVGKTTTLKAIMGIVETRTGSVRLEDREELIVYLFGSERVHKHVDTGLHHALLILQVRGMNVDHHAVPVGLPDERRINFRRHLLPDPSRVVSIVHPNLDLGDLLRRKLLNRRNGFFRGRDFMNGVQRSGPLN